MRNKRSPISLVAGIISLGLLIFFVLSFPPDKNLNVLSFSISLIPIFFVLLLISAYELFSFALNNQRQGFLISFFATLYLILRLNKLTHPFFLILLIAIFITLELLFRKRK